MGWFTKKEKPHNNGNVAKQEIGEAKRAIQEALAHARVADIALDAYIRSRKP